MKILSIVPSDLMKNAATIRILKLISVLENYGHKVDVLCLTNNKNQTIDGRKTIYLDVNIFDGHFQIYKFLINNPYDLIIGNRFLGAFYALAGKLHKTKVLFDIHGGIVEEYMLQTENAPNPLSFFKLSIYKLIEYLTLTFSDKLFCVSHKMITHYNQKGVPLEKMAYITNAVDFNIFKSRDKENNAKLIDDLNFNNKLIFGYMGGTQVWQGVEKFVEAAKQIDDDDLAFLFVGGEDEIYSTNYAILPTCLPSEISKYYSICDVMVLPRPFHAATDIAAPTKFAEYAAMKKPILTTHVGDASKFVSNYNCGIVVTNNEVNTLINGIMQFKNKSHEELLCMGENSRYMCETEFDLRDISQNIMQSILSIFK
jgi:glycosyltransferase involved in cell wall biosynthesis